MDLGAKGIKWKAVSKSEAKKCVARARPERRLRGRS